MGDQPLSLNTRLQTQLSRLLEERKRLLESANKPEVHEISQQWK